MMSSQVRTTDRFERKREAILDAATTLLNQRGVKGLTLADTAEAVGLSTTSVTYYFRKKDDLAAACMLRGITALDEMAAQAMEAPNPPERLHLLLALLFERVRLAAASEAAPLPAVGEMRALSTPVLKTVFEAYAKLFRQLRQIFESPELAGLSHGRRTARTHLLLEQLLWATAWLEAYPLSEYAIARDRLYDILVHGLAAEGEAWAPNPPDLSACASEGGGRETFLLAATRLINGRGYRGASVEKISASLKVTKGSFYHHNEAKDDLVVACFERSFKVQRLAQRQALAAPGSAWSHLSSTVAALLEHQLAPNGPLLRVCALGALPETIRERVVGEAKGISDGFRAMLADGAADGTLRPVDGFIAARTLAATINACSDLRICLPELKTKAAPAVFGRPLLMGIFSP